MTKGKKLSKKLIALVVCACIIGAVLLAAFGAQIAFWVADGVAVWTPDCAQESLDETLEKSALTDGDYDFLYRQTGLTKAGIDRCLQRGEDGKKRIKEIQKGFFETYTVRNNSFCPYICTDTLDKHMIPVYIEEGDIIVTSSTHLSGWRMGHAGLAVSGGRVIQATQVGATSMLGSVADFTNRISFIVLRVKDEFMDADGKAEVAQFAAQNLLGKIYDPTTGVFSSKNQCERTQCAHLVWYAYKQFGLDLDSDGGLVVTPKDLANSPYVEPVQVFGFDPVKLWK